METVNQVLTVGMIAVAVFFTLATVAVMIVTVVMKLRSDRQPGDIVASNESEKVEGEEEEDNDPDRAEIRRSAFVENLVIHIILKQDKILREQQAMAKQLDQLVKEREAVRLEAVVGTIDFEEISNRISWRSVAAGLERRRVIRMPNEIKISLTEE